jgi:glycerol-3-phosphate dehydrogenase
VVVEQGDFGHSTSANSLKIIHGGIRYLQHGDIKRMRESIVSRRAMMAFAPHLVKPLACLMPTYGHGIKGREMMRLAFAIYDLIAADRNCGLPQANHLPKGHSLNIDQVKAEVPGIKEASLTGGAVWYDAIATNTERLILEYLKEAHRYGCIALNYTRADALVEEGGRVSGLRLALRSGEDLTLQCSAVVDAGGPWVGNLARGGEEATQAWAAAINVVVRKRIFTHYAVGLEGITEFRDQDALIKRGKRLFFFVPWLEKYTMIGTVYKPYHGAVDDFAVTPEMLEEIIDEINGIYPSAALNWEDIGYYHGGLLPMKGVDGGGGDTVQLDKSSEIVEHQKTGGPGGYFSIKGVKYTTAPDIAARTIRLMAKTKALPPVRAASYQTVSGGQLDAGETVKRLGYRYYVIRQHLQDRYGTGWRTPFRYIVTDCPDTSDKGLWLCRKTPLLRAELLFFIRDELAITLEDVVLRRSHLGSAEFPNSAVLKAVVALMAEELGWSEQECEQQIASLESNYAPLRR